MREPVCLQEHFTVTFGIWSPLNFLVFDHRCLWKNYITHNAIQLQYSCISCILPGSCGVRKRYHWGSLYGPVATTGQDNAAPSLRKTSTPLRWLLLDQIRGNTCIAEAPRAICKLGHVFRRIDERRCQLKVSRPLFWAQGRKTIPIPLCDLETNQGKASC
jgi:hypothetical protein